MPESFTTSPACLVIEAGEIAPHLAEILRQAGELVGQAARVEKFLAQCFVDGVASLDEPFFAENPIRQGASFRDPSPAV